MGAASISSDIMLSATIASAPGRPCLDSVVAESRSQDLIFLVVRDLSNLATVGVLWQERSGFLQRWNEIAFMVANLVNIDKRTLSRLIRVGFLVGCSTLMSPSLEAVTFKVCIFKTAAELKKKKITRLPRPACIEVTRPVCPLLTVSITCTFRADVNEFFSHNQATDVTSKASSVVSTRCRLPPLSPTQRQLPCQLMHIGKWLPGRATCTPQQVKSSS